MAKGKYTITYTYAGDDNIKKSSGKSKITVKKGMPIKIQNIPLKFYRNKKASNFKVKLVDARGKPVGQKKGHIQTQRKKTYVKKTNKNGIATVKVKLKIGSYKVKLSFKTIPNTIRHQRPIR